MFMSEEFDWSPLGEAFWMEAAATTGASLLQARFACCRHNGMTATGAARLAGYAQEGDGIRQSGSRAAKSTAVLNLLALAVAESGGGDDGLVDSAEAKRILSRLARGSDPNVRIKALESLNKLDRDERAANADIKTSWEDDTRALLAANRNGVGLCAMMFLGAIQDHRPRLALSGIPLFAELAPTISKEFPELWGKMRALLDSDCQAEADRMAGAAATPIAELVPKTETAPAAEVEEESNATA
jgi:hypothetical protein